MPKLPIPPGSSFKPYDYSTLINDTDTAGAGSMLYDVKEPLPGYPCTNSLPPLQGGNCLEDYDFLYPGAEELRYALAGSRNIPAVKAMLSVIPNTQCEENIVSGCVPSINKVISTADAMMDVPNAYQCYSDVALTQPTQCYASSAFGDGAYLTLANHVNGLATLARLGQSIPQTLILQITNSDNKVIIIGLPLNQFRFFSRTPLILWTVCWMTQTRRIYRDHKSSNTTIDGISPSRPGLRIMSTTH